MDALEDAGIECLLKIWAVKEKWWEGGRQGFRVSEEFWFLDGKSLEYQDRAAQKYFAKLFPFHRNYSNKQVTCYIILKANQGPTELRSIIIVSVKIPSPLQQGGRVVDGELQGQLRPAAPQWEPGKVGYVWCSSNPCEHLLVLSCPVLIGNQQIQKLQGHGEIWVTVLGGPPQPA